MGVFSGSINLGDILSIVGILVGIVAIVLGAKKLRIRIKVQRQSGVNNTQAGRDVINHKADDEV
jgi:hypothetical protein